MYVIGIQRDVALAKNSYRTGEQFNDVHFCLTAFVDIATIAAAILFLHSKYLLERNKKKCFCVVLIALRCSS